MQLDGPYSQEANTTYNETGAHIEPSGQKEKGKAKEHLAQRSRSRNVKSRTQMERAGSPSSKSCPVESECGRRWEEVGGGGRLVLKLVGSRIGGR